MTTDRRITAWVTDSRAPCWVPLRRILDDEGVSEFMWMYEVVSREGKKLHLYKHILTRRYLHLDLVGNAYAYVGDDRYRPTPLLPLLEAALGRPVHSFHPPEE